MSYLGELRKRVGHHPLFTVGVSVVLQDEQGRWLLQRRSDSGLWGLPGGGMEPGETFRQAAARELEEETGLIGVPLSEMMSLSGPQMHHVYPHGDEVYLVGLAFRGVLSAAQFSEATLGTDGETLELGLFGLDELPTLNDNVERLMARRLRREAGLPDLPALAYRAVPPAPEGEYLAGLRSVVGPSPLFAPGAKVLVYDDQGRLLLLRNTDTGLWTLPGGGLELGETLEDRARRELLDTTGLRAGRLEELKFYAGAEYRLTHPNGDVIDEVSLLYRAHGLTGSVALQPGEGREWACFALDRLPAPEDLNGPLIRAMLEAAAGL